MNFASQKRLATHSHLSACVKELHEITFGPSISKSGNSRFQDSLVSMVALQLTDPYCRSVHWRSEIIAMPVFWHLIHALGISSALRIVQY